MKINEVEKLTGLSKQNIRFYESKGLICVKREDNQYREYTIEDVHTLQKIIILRKLDFTINEIKEMIDTDDLGNIDSHINNLNKKIKAYNAIIDVCNDMKDSSFSNLNYELINKKINDYEEQGNKFTSFKDDFKLYLERDYMKEFTFIPDTMCVTKGEFTDALIKYAKDHKMELEITKESTSPEFKLDGIPYEATRYTGRYGAYIICTCLDETLIPKQEMNFKRELLVKICYHILPLLIIFLPLTVTIFTSPGPMWVKILLMFAEIVMALVYLVTYGRKLRD